jgi:hypothetical protein
MDRPETLQVSFVLRFWLERDNGSSSWRGRVFEMRDEHVESYVRDGAGLQEFISRKLVELGAVEFPYSLPTKPTDH